MRLSPIVTRLVLPLALVFAICLGLGGVMVQRTLSQIAEREITNEINADFTLLKKQVRRLKVVAVIDAIGFRMQRTAQYDASGVYLLLDSDGQKVTGNITTRTGTKTADGRWHRFTATIDGQSSRILARTENIDEYYTLLVGRRLDNVEQLQKSVAKVLLAIGLITLILSTLSVYWIGRRLSKRFGLVNKAIIAARKGNRTARAPEDGDDEITELAIVINQMLDTLDRQISHLQNISRVIAHEFRSPLAHVKQTLVSYWDAKANDSDALSESLEQINGLLTLSTQLLDIAEHESSFALPVMKLNLGEVMQSVQTLFSEVASEKEIDLIWDLQHTPVRGEKWLIVRLAANLMENAIEATPTLGRVTCETFHRGELSVLRISDTGCGSKYDTIENMIKHQTPPDLRQPDDNKHGIGLKMVQAIAVRHGARIKIINSVSGLTVEVFFPKG